MVLVMTYDHELITGMSQMLPGMQVPMILGCTSPEQRTKCKQPQAAANFAIRSLTTAV